MKHADIDTAPRFREDQGAEISSGLGPESGRTATATPDSTGSCGGIEESVCFLESTQREGGRERVASWTQRQAVKMFDIALRRWKDSVADPVAQIIPIWISPIQVTGAAFVVGLLACVTAASTVSGVLAFSFWVANRFLDCVDGSLARHRKTASDLGGFLDLLSDFIIYSILPIAIAYGEDKDQYYIDWVSIAMLEATFHVNNFILFYSAAVAAQKDDQELTSVTMRPALIEGFESGLLFTAMLMWPHYINMWARIMSIGVVVGIIQRSLTLIHVLGPKTHRHKLH